MNINIYGMVNSKAHELGYFLTKVGVQYCDEKADDETRVIRIPASEMSESFMLLTTLNDHVMFSDYKTNMCVAFHVSDFERLVVI